MQLPESHETYVEITGTYLEITQTFSGEEVTVFITPDQWLKICAYIAAEGGEWK
jgi:hypothetical protein